MSSILPIREPAEIYLKLHFCSKTVRPCNLENNFYESSRKSASVCYNILVSKSNRGAGSVGECNKKIWFYQTSL